MQTSTTLVWSNSGILKLQNALTVKTFSTHLESLPCPQGQARKNVETLGTATSTMQNRVQFVF